LIDKIFNITTEAEFEELALEIFRFQAENNKVYKDYLYYLSCNVNKVDEIKKIPFLPIEFFKKFDVIINNHRLSNQNRVIFKSSGTTKIGRSRHIIIDINLYEKSFTNTFIKFFGKPDKYIIIALLPSYIETGDSSLVYMVDKLIKMSNRKESGFYLNKNNEIIEIIEKHKDQNILLFGVTYALLDLIENKNYYYPKLKIIETGGMKGRKEEITRTELHTRLKNGFGTNQIYSEYGMTELLSQAYCFENEWFEPSDTMRIFIRDVNDPFCFLENNKTGGINIIDLANIYSCSFIETKDLGKKNDKKFQVSGRFDNSDIRGCNLLIV